MSNGDDGSVAFGAKDILNNDAFYLYKDQKLLGVSRQIIWETEEAQGLGLFEDVEAPKKFAQYGELYHFEGETGSFYRIFNLPEKLGPELADLKIPDYAKGVYETVLRSFWGM